MSFRVQLGISIAVALGISLTVVLLSVAYVRTRIMGEFSPELAVQVDSVLQLLLLQQALALFVVSVLLAIGTFWVIGATVAKPLKNLVSAMDTYAQTGEYVEMGDVEGAPTEIQSLHNSFSAFINRAAESHKHDTEVSRVKSDFISTAAHQLRTPLTGIRWALEALEKEQLTENQRALIVSAKDKSKDLVAIVGTLLDISAIESGKYQYVFETVDMEKLLESMVQDFGPVAAQKQISLFYSHEHKEGEVIPSARADRERIKWVLNNLIDNALQYTPAGGSVRLSLDVSERRLFIRVKDNGIGIPAEDRASIFERFYRAQNAVTKQQKGNGLGLYIARTIATDHGGDLSFAGNEDGAGTTFTLALPVAS